MLQRLDSHPAQEIYLMTPKNWKELIRGTTPVESGTDSEETQTKNKIRGG
jgi:hypothetical protein